ncbi:MAG TPA: glycosyltransferase, partial [Flavisolibacter sp.]
PVKQHHLVIELLPQIRQQFPDVKLVLVGTGDQEQNLRDLAGKLGVTDCVHFAGFQTNIHDYIYHSDISLVPSSAEGFGVVILEAWHNAKPVIAFDVPAPNEIIEDNKDGFLVKPFDKAELLNRILLLLQNKKLSADMGQAGYDKLQQYFTMDVMLEKTLAMYQRALAE